MPHRRQQRNTPQRRIVLEELQKSTSHPTAVELYQIVRSRLPSISLGTVYRNLELLSRTGIIQKLELGGAQVRFDGNPNCHRHVRCIRCGRVDDLDGLPDNLIMETPKEAGGYKIIGHRMEFVGICADCRNREEGDSRSPGDGEP